MVVEQELREYAFETRTRTRSQTHSRTGTADGSNASASLPVPDPQIEAILARASEQPDEALRTLIELVQAQDRLIAVQNATITALRAEAGTYGSQQAEREQELRRELHRASEQITGLRAKLEHLSLRDQELVAEIRRTLARRRRPRWQVWKRNP